MKVSKPLRVRIPDRVMGELHHSFLINGDQIPTIQRKLVYIIQNKIGVSRRLTGVQQRLPHAFPP